MLYCHLEFVFLIFRIILRTITCVSYFCKISWILILCILTKNLVTVTIIETKIWLIMFLGSPVTQWAWMVEISKIWNSLLLNLFVNSKCRDVFFAKTFLFLIRLVLCLTLAFPTKTPCVFHVETTWNDRFHVVPTWNTRGVFVG